MPSQAFTDDSTDALIASRLPVWMTTGSLDTLYALHHSQQRQQQVQQELHELLACITPLEAFAAPLLQQALQTQHALTLDVREARLRRRTLQRSASYIAQVPDGVREQVHEHSLLEAALHNFTERETFAAEVLQGSAVLDPSGLETGLSLNAFARLCRTLDLGGRYQAYLRAQLTPDGEAGRQLEALLEEGFRASLEATLRLSLAKGEIGVEAYAPCAPLFALLAAKPESACGLRPMQLRVFGQRVRSAVAFEFKQHGASGSAVEGVLCWIPDDPQGALTWYASWEMLFLALGKQFRLPGYKEFFQRFIGERDREAYARGLAQALQGVGVDVPVRLDGRYEAIEVPLFEHLRQQQIDTLLDNASVQAPPTAAVDAQVRDRRLHFYRSFALDAVGLVSFALPVLAAPLLGITALQVADDVYEGYADWRLGDRQEALEHLYAVAETVIMTALNVGAGAASQRLARADRVDELVPVYPGEGTLKLCDPALPGYGVEDRGAVGELTQVQGQAYVRTPLASHMTYLDEATQQRRIRHPLRSDAYAPVLEDNGAGGWRHALENPQEWQGSVQLMQDLSRDWAQLDERTVHEVMRATGYDEAQLRGLHIEQAPPPARLRDAVQRHQLHAQFPRLEGEAFERQLQAQQGSPSPAQTLMRRDFPGLTVLGAGEIIDHAPEDLVEHMQAHQRVPLALAEQARWYIRDARLDRACAGLLQAAAINRDTERLALGLIADRAPWRAVRLDVRGDTLAATPTASAGAPAATHVRTVLRTAQGYQALDALGQPLPSASAEDSLFKALLLQLDPWQKKVLGDACESPEALADALSLWASEHRERAAALLGMAPVGLGFRPPVRLGDGRVGYPLSGRGESSNRALRRGLQQLFPASDEHTLDHFTATARSLGLSPWNYYLRLCDELRALDQALGQWRRQASGPLQFLRRARMARRIRRAWQRRDHDASGNRALTLEGSRLGTLPDLAPTVSFDHVTTLTLRSLDLGEVSEGFLARFPNVTRLNLSGNRLTSIPDTSHLQCLQHIDLRDNRIAEVSQAQAARLRANVDEVQLQGNPLSQRARERLHSEPAPVVQEPAVDGAPWFDGLAEAQANQCREQWRLLRAQVGSERFFSQLAELSDGPAFIQHPAEMRRQVVELLNAMYHHGQVRSALFEQAAVTRGRADLAAWRVRMQVVLRTEGLRGRRVERELRNLGRELFRLDQLDRFAARHIEALRTGGEPVNENDIYLAFRAGLAESLGLHGQPSLLSYEHVDTVTLGNLADAEAHLYETETPEVLSQFLAQQPFWQEYVQAEYLAPFAAIRRDYHLRLAAAVPEGEGQAPAEVIERLRDQRREEEQAMTLTLARGNYWTWYRLDGPHGPNVRGFSHLSRRLEHNLMAWRGHPGDPEYKARSYIAGVLRDVWLSNYQDQDSSLNSTIEGLSISSLPTLPAGIVFDRLRTLSLSNQQLTAVDSAFLRCFPNLEEVDLSGNSISRFDGLEHLPYLRRLNLGGNLLTTVTGLQHLSQLTELDLSGNQLEELPAGIEQLGHLRDLDLSFNQLTDLSERACRLTSLENLHLSGNLLGSVPRRLGNLERLVVLDLSANRLTTVPEHLNGLGRLTQLYLHDNVITLDAGSELRLEWFSRLEILSLAGNPLGIVPRLRYNPHLSYLSLRATGMRSFPLALMQRHPDLVVDLRGNRIATLSEDALSWIETHAANVNLEHNVLSSQVMERVRAALIRFREEAARGADIPPATASRKPPSRHG